MTKDDIQLLYPYDRWANHRVLQAVSALREEQFTRDLGGSFRSVRDTLMHSIAGEWDWLRSWKEPSADAAHLTDLRTRRDALFKPDAFPNVAAVKAKWKEVEEEQLKFVNRLTSEAPGQNASFSHDAGQLGAPHATPGKPFHLPSRSNCTDDAPATRPASGQRLP